VGKLQIPKDKIIQFLKEQGDHDKAAKAEQELPDQVDHEEHSNLLAKHGINPSELVQKVGL
jgi:DNA-binding protein H-NS